ncbi:MAG: hypothetical protein NWF07_02860, partial [Candidatus Bathyarchaeota archaeon]|nr:hypothetical protein [Candidatus Bathyarchaeota archaeon]
GYNYNYSKILYPVESVEKIALNRGQLQYEFEILQERLSKRAPSKYFENKDTVVVEPHPLFTIREGSIEPWEKGYWNNL